VLAFAFPCAVRRPSKGDLAGITLVGLSLEIARGQQLIGGLVLLVLSATFEHRVPVRFDTAGIAALLYLALVASAGAHTVALWLAGATSATFAASWTYVSPFVRAPRRRIVAARAGRTVGLDRRRAGRLRLRRVDADLVRTLRRSEAVVP
jgi:hypothetical protein